MFSSQKQTINTINRVTGQQIMTCFCLLIQIQYGSLLLQMIGTDLLRDMIKNKGLYHSPGRPWKVHYNTTTIAQYIYLVSTYLFVKKLQEE